ncbi:MAG: MFS transporter [Acidobacteriota bacterium]
MTRRSVLPRLLAPIVVLRDAETATALLMFAYSFLAMTAYNIVKPITRSKFIDDLGADNLPYVLLGAGLFIGVVMQLYGRLVGLLPRRWVIPCTGCGMTILLIAFWFLFRTDNPLVSAAFYLYGLIIGILLISQFWTLANDLYDPRQAKRLFGFIGGGASLGGMTGAGVTALLVDTVGTENLLLGSATVLGACMLVVSTIVRRERVQGAAAGVPAHEERLTGTQAIRLLRESRHLQVIALVIGFAVIGGAIIEQQLNMAAEAFRGGEGTDALTGFLAEITFYLSVAGFVVQVGVTSRVHRVLGIGFALLLLPVSLGATALVMLVSGALWAPAFARILDTSLRYTIDKTTREILFLPLPVALKYQAKPFVDVTVDRFAKGLAALLLLGLIKGAGLTWQQLSYASVAITVIWVAAAVRARREYLAAFRRSLERQEIEAPALRLPVADVSTLEMLVQELAHPNERRVIHAIDLLEAFEKGQLVTPLLLRHPSAKVRIRALGALESARPDIGEHWLNAGSVEPMLHDENLEVRVAAVRALAAIRGSRAADVMRPYLGDKDPRVSVTAAIALVDGERHTDRAEAASVLARLSAESGDGMARREVAAALAKIADPALRHLLVPLMYDKDVTVAEEAIRSVQRSGARDRVFLPVLMSLLGHRLLKRTAREALISYGEDALDTLARVLRDPEEPVWVRRHVPATLARIPCAKSIDILIGALGECDGFLRFKAVSALERLRQEHPDLVIPRGPVEHVALTEVRRYRKYLGLYSGLLSNPSTAIGDTLLARALREKLRRTWDRTFRLLGLIHPQQDVRNARWAIEHGSGPLRAGAIEYLDNILSGQIRKRLMSLLEVAPRDDQARQGQAPWAGGAGSCDESLKDLMADEDPILAAAARHVVAEPRDAEPEDCPARRAAPLPPGAHASGEPLPLVDVVDRLRRIPLFDFVSVDELFRIATAARQVLHEAGDVLYREGEAHDVVQMLLHGAVRLERFDRPAENMNPPAALGFEEVIEPCPMQHTTRAVEPVVCLALTRDEFFAILAENPELMQGVFRMLLDNPVLRGWRALVRTDAAHRMARPAPGEPTPVEEVALLQEIPLFARASAKELLDVAAITRRVPFGRGARAFSEGDVSAICMPLSGRLTLRQPEGGLTEVVGPGDIVGIYETLVGDPAGCRGEVIEAGVALRIDRDDLFDLLSDHLNLLHGLFREICTRPRPQSEPVRG